MTTPARRPFKLPALALVALFAPLTAASAASAATGAKAKTPVFVLATLYKRHESVPAYDLATLRKVMEAIQPEVLVLDVTPDELKAQKVWPSKIEYPGAAFPLMNERKLPTYPSEPAQPLFAELTGAGGAAHKAFREQHAADAAALDRYVEATFEAFKLLWKSPADVNSAATDAIIAGKRRMETLFVGPIAADVERRWNEHHVARVADAVREHPGRRVLMLVGVDNRYQVVELLRDNPGVAVVDMEAWLRANYRP